MPIIPNTNGTETLKEVLLIFATPEFKVSVPYKIKLSGFTKSPNNDLLTSYNYNYNTRDIRFLQRYKLKIKRCRLEKKFSIILAIINYAINFNGFFIIFTWNTNRKKIALL